MTVTGKLRQIEWLSEVIYPLVVILMETFWVYPWLIWLGHLPFFTEARSPVSFFSVIIILAVSLGTTRFFSKRDWPISRVRAAIIGCGIISVCLVFRIEYGSGFPLIGGGWFAHIRELLSDTFSDTHAASAAIPVGIILWWRGILLERRSSSFDGVYRLFNLGVVALIGLIAGWLVTFRSGEYPGAIESIRLYAIGFFCSGLTALAIANLRLKKRKMTGQEGETSLRRALLMILAVIGLITLLGFLAAALFSPGFFASIGTGFTAVWSVITKGLYYVVYPFVYLAAIVFELLKRLIALLGKSETFEIQSSGGPLMEEIEHTAREMPGIVTTLLQILAGAALLAFVIVLLAKAIKRIRGDREEGVEEIHESVLSLDALRKDLGQLLAKLGRVFGRRQKPGVSYDDEVEDLSVREIYKRLLWEGQRKGVERLGFETPAEYASRLKVELPEGDQQLYEITGYYTRVRYGDKEVSTEEAGNVRGLWVLLRSSIRSIGEVPE